MLPFSGASSCLSLSCPLLSQAVLPTASRRRRLHTRSSACTLCACRCARARQAKAWLCRTRLAAAADLIPPLLHSLSPTEVQEHHQGRRLKSHYGRSLLCDGSFLSLPDERVGSLRRHMSLNSPDWRSIGLGCPTLVFLLQCGTSALAAHLGAVLQFSYCSMAWSNRTLTRRPSEARAPLSLPGNKNEQSSRKKLLVRAD